MKSASASILNALCVAAAIAFAGHTALAQQAEPDKPKAAPAAKAKTAHDTHSKPSKAGLYASESEAKSHCGGGEIVWTNTQDHLNSYPGTPDYGKSKPGGFACENSSAMMGEEPQKPRKTHQ